MDDAPDGALNEPTVSEPTVVSAYVPVVHDPCGAANAVGVGDARSTPTITGVNARNRFLTMLSNTPGDVWL